MLNHDSGEESGNWWPSFAGSTDSGPSSQEMPLGGARFETDKMAPNGLIYRSPVPIEGTPTHSLAEVLRMDITREWVYQRWARKTTGLTDPEMFGVRVPLVTGTKLTDLAGSLSYYFNRQGQVQRISFRGWTGDATQLVNFLTSQYGFKRGQSPFPGEQLYQITWNNRVQSQLRTRPDTVLWATSPHNSVLVELELERPGSNRYLEQQSPFATIPELTAVSDQSQAEQVAASDAKQAATASAEAKESGKEAEEVANLKVDLPPRRRWPQ